MQTILLAEDDQTMVSLLRTLLEIEGFKVITFGGKTQEELINLLVSNKPDIMLMDVNLHKINGVDALRMLRQNTRLKDLRVIMTSGSDLKDVCVKEGANYFLMKPFMPDTLIKAINGQLPNQ